MDLELGRLSNPLLVHFLGGDEQNDIAAATGQLAGYCEPGEEMSSCPAASKRDSGAVSLGAVHACALNGLSRQPSRAVAAGCALSRVTISEPRARRAILSSTPTQVSIISKLEPP